MNLPPLLALFSINKILGIPALASEHGEMVDHMLELVHWFMLILGIGWSAVAFRRRRVARGSAA